MPLDYNPFFPFSNCIVQFIYISNFIKKRIPIYFYYAINFMVSNNNSIPKLHKLK